MRITKMNIFDRISGLLDDFGNFGFESWKNSRRQKTVLLIATTVGLLCTIGFSISIASYSMDIAELKITAFAVTTIDGARTYYGLQGVVSEYTGVVTTVTYKSAACSISSCSSCNNILSPTY